MLEDIDADWPILRQRLSMGTPDPGPIDFDDCWNTLKGFPTTVYVVHSTPLILFECVVLAAREDAVRYQYKKVVWAYAKNIPKFESWAPRGSPWSGVFLTARQAVTGLRESLDRDLRDTTRTLSELGQKLTDLGSAKLSLSGLLLEGG